MKDPWRYQCPECGGHGELTRRVSMARSDWDDGEAPYRCGACNSHVPGRYDKLDDVTKRPDGSIVQEYTPPVVAGEPVPKRYAGR